nr:GGDEF domain-containing protein [uncultured Cohaesibacter sp.]
MLNSLDIATIYVCMFLSLLVAASTMAVVWYSHFQDKAAGYWTLSYILGITASILLALQEQLGPFAPALCTALVIGANIAIFSGFRAFNGYATFKLPFFVAPAVYLLFAALEPRLYNNPNMNVLVQSIMVTGISSANAYLLLTGAGNRELPMTLPASIILMVHATARVCIVFLVLFDPAPVINTRMESTWWKLFLLEIFFNTTMMAISTIILIKDRSEQHHRIASETDDLTGIENRRAFVKKINNALLEDKPDAVLAILDVDHFKQINDTYGHDAGDKALIDLVKTVKRALPTFAMLGRMGGEEFAIFMSGRGLKHQAIFERVRAQIAQTTFEYEGLAIKLTSSIGYASVESVGCSFDNLFTAADCAMYRAKKEGRNRVLAYKPSMRIRELLDEEPDCYTDFSQVPLSLKVG